MTVRKISGSAPVISKPALWFFRRIVREYFRWHFEAIRLSGVERFSGLSCDSSKPLIVYANHAGWWDPLVLILLSGEYMPGRSHFAPMDATALRKNRILERVGIFPVEMNSPRGAAQFLRAGLAIAESGGVLWVTPQGRFADARERPLQLKPGMAALAVKLAPCTLLPLAIEYPFWNQRRPECLLRFGEPVEVRPQENSDAVQRLASLALEASMEELSQLALLRDPNGFTTRMQGKHWQSGVAAAANREGDGRA